MHHADETGSRGFAAKASVKALESVAIMGASYNPFIEEDSIVSVNGEIAGNARAS